MITFFRNAEHFYAVESREKLGGIDVDKLNWLFGDAECIAEAVLAGSFVGPRREMVTPWSTNAVEITQNMGISGITRIEEFTIYEPERSGARRSHLRFGIFEQKAETAIWKLKKQL
jgi:phosphoribosylformylglycinamidine synthase